MIGGGVALTRDRESDGRAASTRSANGARIAHFRSVDCRESPRGGASRPPLPTTLEHGGPQPTGGFSVRFRFLSSSPSLAAIVVPGHGVGVRADRPERDDVELKVAQRPGAAQLQGARQAVERPRLGRGQRDPAHDCAQAGRVQARLLGRLGDGEAGCLEDVHEHVPAPTTAPSCSGSSPPARPPTARTGPCRPGSGCCPNYGLQPSAKQSVWELRLSHWAGPIARADGQAELGLPQVPPHVRLVHVPRQAGLRLQVDAGGEPLDTFGRNLYVDTFDSAYGPGWKRENSFLTHRGTGVFCYGFYLTAAARSGGGSATAPRSSARA